MVLHGKVQRRRSRRAAVVAGEVPALFTPEEWLTVGRLLRLTPRQRAVAELLCAECSQRDMAQRLGLSVDTIRAHLRALYARLCVRSRVGVIVRLVLAQRELPGAQPTVPKLRSDPAPARPAPAAEALAVGAVSFP